MTETNLEEIRIMMTEEWQRYLTKLPFPDEMNVNFLKDKEPVEGIKLFKLCQCLLIPNRMQIRHDEPQLLSNFTNSKKFVKLLRSFAQFTGLPILPKFSLREKAELVMEDVRFYYYNYVVDQTQERFAIPVEFCIEGDSCCHMIALILKRVMNKKTKKMKMNVEIFEPKGYVSKYVDFYKKLDVFVRSMFYNSEQITDYNFTFVLKDKAQEDRLDGVLSFQAIFLGTPFENCSQVLCLWYMFVRLLLVNECWRASVMRIWLLLSLSKNALPTLENAMISFVFFWKKNSDVKEKI
jgi:hypothetical protein